MLQALYSGLSSRFQNTSECLSRRGWGGGWVCDCQRRGFSNIVSKHKEKCNPHSVKERSRQIGSRGLKKVYEEYAICMRVYSEGSNSDPSVHLQLL